MEDPEQQFWKDCDLVESVPERLNGRPVVKGTRVAADTIPESEETGRTPEEIASDYRLRLSDVKALLAYAAKREASVPTV